MDAVLDILFREWDPICVSHFPKCFDDEYDRYARAVCRYLEAGIDEFRLAAYLFQIRTVGMGLSRSELDRDKLIARRLLALKS